MIELKDFCATVRNGKQEIILEFGYLKNSSFKLEYLFGNFNIDCDINKFYNLKIISLNHKSYFTNKYKWHQIINDH
jgi:hypothetical protein